MRNGYTFAELLVVMAIVVIVGLVGILNLVGSRSGAELTENAKQIAALLREAQSRAAIQSSSTSWSVRFDNGANPFYALYGGAYSTNTRISYTPLPRTIDFATSTVPENGYVTVSFDQLSGRASGSSTIRIFALRDPASSATITIATSGVVSY